MTAVAILTVVHVVLSLIGLGAGFVVIWGFLKNARLDRWTGVFLGSTILTSASGFLFPVDHVTPAHVFGVISLVVLAVAVLARYRHNLAGWWRAAYVISSVVAQYLNFFVFVVQLFLKVPVLKALAPTQTEPTFVAVQLVTLVAFATIGIAATLRFHGGNASPAIGETKAANVSHARRASVG